MRSWAELHADGSGATGDPVRVPRGNFVREGEHPPMLVDEDLVWDTARGLRLLGAHATENAGAFGEAAVGVAVPRLHGYERLVPARNPRSAYVSPGNLGDAGFKLVLQALE